MRIPDEWLNGVVFLYPNCADANAGEWSGGTGFLLCVPLEDHKEHGVVYLVTNRHVAEFCTCARVGLKDGGLALWDLEADCWLYHQRGEDVAITDVTRFVSSGKFAYKHVDRPDLISRDIVKENDIGIGDEVFSFGRLVTDDGLTKNIPIARFGRISRMPDEAVKVAGLVQQCFFVEMTSIGGFSGSPVFVNIPPLTVRPVMGPVSILGGGPWLLGINQAMKLDPERNENINLSIVIPAWTIDELLDHPSLVAQRGRSDLHLQSAGS